MATQAFIATYKDRQGKEKSLRVKAADLASAKRNLRQRGILASALSRMPVAATKPNAA